MILRFSFAGLLLVTQLCAQNRTVAVTVDDLPYAAGGGVPKDAKVAQLVNRKLLAAFAHYHVPVSGFVIGKRVEELGVPVGTRILQDWISHGLDLGNHTYSHPDINQLTTAQIEDEITRGEASYVPLMKSAARKPEFFRFPYNHTGDTKEKHDAIAAFLAGRGYRLAPCTIDNSDYIFNTAYVLMLERRDNAAAARLREAYIAYTGAEIDYYSALHKQIFGYEPPHVMLLHDNRLNADVIGQVLALFVNRHYRFVTLNEAESDAVYQIPETFVTKFGMMWGYRWATEKNVKVNGRLEPDPPEWIPAYEKKNAAPR